MEKVELMAPAGNYESLQAALNAGADSVYFGVGQLQMRSKTAAFDIDAIPEIVKRCKEKNAKSYLVINTIVYNNEITDVQQLVDAAKKGGVTAIIAADFAVLQYCKDVHMPVHISTQANISNIEAVKFFSQFADVMVLARELTLEQITDIAKQIQEQQIKGPHGEIVRLEAFAHGALCIAISGKCYMSLSQTGVSANRGHCRQMCRKSYTVTDTETGKELEVDNEYIMSPKDLCTIQHLDKLMKSGISVLKIEGRGRAPEYVSTVIQTYRSAIDAIEKGEYTKENIAKWTNDLESVYNRGFWHGGYYMGSQLGDEWSNKPESKSTLQKVYIGIVQNYYQKKKVAQVLLEASDLTLPAKVLFTGPTTGVMTVPLTEVWENNKEEKECAKQGSEITFPVPDMVRESDKVYVLIKRKE